MVDSSVAGDCPTGFQIAGKDRQWVWAAARIDPGEPQVVCLRHSSVKTPLQVRYGWADNPAVNLFNQAGLPAIPFRTDDWPGITVDRK